MSLDVSQAYLQVPLKYESKKMVVVNTLKGPFCCLVKGLGKRL